MIRIAQGKDAIILAKIHFTELKNDFLPSLGLPFLIKLYEMLIKLPGTIILVSYAGNRITGFIVGSSDFTKDFNDLIKNNFINFFLVLIPAVIKKPLLTINLFHTLFYPRFSKTNKIKSELVVIAIVSKNQRQGFGKKLILTLEKEFAKKNIKGYKVSVNTENKAANEFYKSLGFRRKYKFKIYGKNINLLYKPIKQ